MHIISASRRTDIPAWYGPWLMRRIEAGKAAYRNPFSREMHEVSLRPEEVIAFVFWTKNGAPFLEGLQNILGQGYKAYFQYTVTGYGPLLEGAVPPWRKAVSNFKRLADLIGPRYMRWRYDPIILTSRHDRDFHMRNFSTMASCLEGFTEQCHVSFVQFYQKTRKNFQVLGETTGLVPEDRDACFKIDLARDLQAVAASRGIKLVGCCTPLLLEAGIEQGRCVDPELIRSLRPDLELHLKTRPTREGCLCAESRDIGAYDTCPGACVYCYATRDPGLAQKNRAAHRRDGESLF